MDKENSNVEAGLEAADLGFDILDGLSTVGDILVGVVEVIGALLG